MNSIDQLRETVSSIQEKEPELESVLILARKLKALHAAGPRKGGRYPPEFYQLKAVFKQKVGHDWSP